MMKFVNLTPHEIVIMQEGKGNIYIPASGVVARCKQETRILSPIVTAEGISIPCGINSYGDIEGLPKAELGTYFITSSLVAQAAWALGREDVLCPLQAVRDSEGRIIGTTGLAMPPHTILDEKNWVG